MQVSKHIQDKVEKVLQDSISARSSDRLLMLKIWEDEGLRLTQEQQQAFMKVSSPETIRRNRQKLQEDGKYRATADVEAKRAYQEQEVRAAIRYMGEVKEEIEPFNLFER